MAKQTFTTGQVLTAAQMTSLQQTAMGGGSATAKTASYTLVAADAGATVIMNSASATTITVNTSLFSAGDTVFIQNIGAGVSTITPGTATVNTASSLALAQYESGSLYFTAAGASIFSKADGAAAGSGGGMTLLSTTSLTGASTTVGSINQTYKDLIVIISGMSGATNGQDFQCAPNGTTNIVYQTTNGRFSTTSYNDGETAGYVNFTDGCGHNNSTTVNSWTLRISQYAATDKGKPFAYSGYFQSNQSGAPLAAITGAGGINTNTAISSLVFSMSSGNLSTGTVLVYGVS